MSAQLPPPSLVRALRHLLRPIVRLLLAKGVGYPALVDLLKEIFVDVADKEFRIAGKAQTDSRISLLTGIHRKDVKRLRAAPFENHEMPEAVSLGMRVVSAWGAPPFADEDGLPMALPRLASNGGEASFESLVASVSKDIRARALLDEWVRLGVVSVDDEDRVCLDTSAFVPTGLEEKAFYFGHNLHDHAAAAVANVLSDSGIFLERSVHHGGLPEKAIAPLAREAERAGMRLLHSLNRRALENQGADPTGTDAGRRFTFGIYFYAEPDDEAPELPSGETPDPH